VLVGQVVALDGAKSFMMAGIELRARAGIAVTCNWRRTSSICLTIISTPERNCSVVPPALRASSKWSSTGRNFRRHCRRHNRDWRFSRALPLAGVLKFSLQPGEAVEELIALGLELVKLFTSYGLRASHGLGFSRLLRRTCAGISMTEFSANAAAAADASSDKSTLIPFLAWFYAISEAALSFVSMIVSTASAGFSLGYRSNAGSDVGLSALPV